MKNKFIVIEGIDGSGKTTQIDILAKRLADGGFDAAVTAEPTDGAAGKLIREILSGKKKIAPSALAALFLADRIEHNQNSGNGIKKLLSEGKTVLCGRYYYATFAYQGLECGFDWLFGQNLGCADILKPDICLFLDIPPEICMDRINKSRKLSEIEIFENIEALRKIRENYLTVFGHLKGSENIKIIDAAGSEDEVSRQIYNIIK
ncbi:MAG: dTMP kinase [Oscillospiraceae bacterium]|nr:dTMP kinase [Oscillospiraceae bacterium]